MRSESMRARPVGEEPLDLDKHRGIAEQKATDLRRTLAEVENHARELRDRQTALEDQLQSVPAETWPEAAAKARYALNLYVAGLSLEDTRHRNLVAAIFDDFERLSRDS
jgi:predicted  nucleic acid-binding Zn-ribbon protein